MTNPAPRLSTRMDSVRDLWIEGLSMKEIGRELDISWRTVESHIEALRTKYQARSRIQLMKRMMAESGFCPCCGRGEA